MSIFLLYMNNLDYDVKTYSYTFLTSMIKILELNCYCLGEVEMYESRENYLETILILEKKNGVVKSIDIAKELNYSKASVSRAVGILKESGLIIMMLDGEIILTENGRKKAEEIYEKHILITRFLINTLGVSFNIAEKDACRIEHVISNETFERIKKYLDKN